MEPLGLAAWTRIRTWIGTKNLGMLLLGVYLIGVGLMAFVTITFVNMGLILALIALAAGVMILLGR